MQATEAVDEARRVMQVCNACRYCEGFCAVFPAMELRRRFTTGDLTYLANLCHDCRGCYHACQYAPPHEFGINVPQTFAVLRLETYAEYAWPRPMAALFERSGTIVSLATAAGIALVLLLTAWLRTPTSLFTRQTGPGAFYRVIPEAAMTAVAAVTCLFALLAFTVGAIRFWRDTGGGAAHRRSMVGAVSDVLTLRNLGGGGHGCNDLDGAFSETRRYFHHALFYGFGLCLASTIVAAAYDHLLGLPAPYPFFSVPVLLGTVGGLGMVAGTAGLVWIKVAGDPAVAARTMMGADYALLVQLFLAAATGLALLALRDTRAMGLLLAVHLGAILAVFVMLPYSKFVHGIYRSVALLRNAHERRVDG